MPIQKFFLDIAGGPAPSGVDTTLNMSYFIRVTDIMKMDEFTTFQMELMQTKKRRPGNKGC